MVRIVLTAVELEGQRADATTSTGERQGIHGLSLSVPPSGEVAVRR
jgi:hypothetical protein